MCAIRFKGKICRQMMIMFQTMKATINCIVPVEGSNGEHAKYTQQTRYKWIEICENTIKLYCCVSPVD